MLESLGRIKNPAVRSLTSAFGAFSAIVLAASVAIGATRAKDESAYKAALSAALIGAGCGGVFGLVYTRQGNRQDTVQALQNGQSIQATAPPTWKDWRNFVVVRKVKESEEITSFYLQPEDRGEIPSFQPGQFLTIKLDIPGQAKPVIRTYSLSDYPEPFDYYRLSIKREPMPEGLAVPPGIASNFMHDQVQEGAVIPAKPPSGKFILEVDRSLPAVLISNGVGITPMISMAKAVARLHPTRPVWFIHGARDGRFHAFRDEVTALAKRSEGTAEPHPNLMIHYVYSRPRPEDEGHYHSVGYVDTALIQSLVSQEAEYFLCGSPPFLRSLMAGLKEAGVPENRIFFEMFTKASQPTAARPAVEVSDGSTEDTEIVFAQSKKTVLWQAEANNLLEFAEANDLNPPYSCRQGICGTCECKLLAGEVEYQEPPTAAVEPGSVLICISKPKTSRLVLDL